MKKIVSLFLLLACAIANAQTFKVNNLQVNGNSTFSGTTAFTSTPTAPTLSVGNSSTSLATSAFVANHSPCPSIMDHGGDNTDTNDNTSALTSTLAAGPGGQACAYFPPGTYKFTQAYVYSFPGSSTGTASVTLLGAGSEVTVLDFTANSAFLTLNYVSQYNSSHIRDLTVTTTQSGGASQGIVLNQANTSVTDPAREPVSDISHVTLRGSDGYGVTQYWSNAINVIGVGNVNFDSMYIFGSSAKQGTGVNIGGTSLVIPVVYNFYGCGFVYMNTGIIYGAYVQGVSVSQSNFTHVQTGISVPASLTGLDQLYVSGSQIEASANGISIGSGLGGIAILGTLFIVDNAANGVNFNSVTLANTQIVGNTFATGGGTPNNGIFINGAGTAVIISANSFTGMTNGINLAASSATINVQSNAYKNNTTNVGNIGTGNTVGGGSQ